LSCTQQTPTSLNTSYRNIIVIGAAVCSLFNAVNSTFAQGTAFSYQGKLSSSGYAATGIYDFAFALYDASSGGTQQGATVTTNAVGVSNGLFTVTLDFGNQFTGNARWLDVSVRTNGAGSFTELLPRQPLTAVPHAIATENLNGTLPSGQLAGTYGSAVTFNNVSNKFTGSGAGLTGVNAATLGGLAAAGFWQLAGNAGTTPGVNFLGTTDNQPLEIRVNNQRAVRIEYTTDTRAVLEKLCRLPVTEWNLISQPAGIRHIGPMAQDFQAAFGVGEDDRHISTSDADGVALAAIQGLNQKVEQAVKEKDAQIQTLEKDVAELKATVNSLVQKSSGGAQ
jgi:hypothetical protein